jgi:hypothetical protein
MATGKETVPTHRSFSSAGGFYSPVRLVQNLRRRSLEAEERVARLLIRRF